MSGIVTLKKEHFGDCFFLLSGGVVSNGHWAIKPEVVKNAALVASVDAAKQAFGVSRAKEIASTFEQIGPSGELHEWAATAFLNDLGRTVARVFQSTKTGEFVGLDRRYLAILDRDAKGASMYGVAPGKPFVNAPTLADAVFLVMPVRIDAFPQETNNG